MRVVLLPGHGVVKPEIGRARWAVRLAADGGGRQNTPENWGNQAMTRRRAPGASSTRPTRAPSGQRQRTGQALGARAAIDHGSAACAAQRGAISIIEPAPVTDSQTVYARSLLYSAGAVPSVRDNLMESFFLGGGKALL